MLKYIVGGFVVVAVLGATYYALIMSKPASPAAQPPTNATQQMGMATSTFATSTYSIVYPSDYTKDEMYAYDQFGPAKLIHGVKFTIPGTMATGTNLSADTYIAVEQLPRAKNCTADIYIKEDVHAAPFTDGSVQYSLATTSGAAAGNMYEEMVYALSGTSPCTALRYVVHTSNIDNYEPGMVQEFNRDALMNAFDTIRRSLQITQATAPTVMTP